MEMMKMEPENQDVIETYKKGTKENKIVYYLATGFTGALAVLLIINGFATGNPLLYWWALLFAVITIVPARKVFGD